MSKLQIFREKELPAARYSARIDAWKALRFPFNLPNQRESPALIHEADGLLRYHLKGTC